MSEQELKPCPFCGGAAMLQITKNKSDQTAQTEQYYIQCVECKASSMKVTITEEQSIYADETDTTIQTTVDNIIKAWNTRDRDTPKRYAKQPRTDRSYNTYMDPVCPKCGTIICYEPFKRCLPNKIYCQYCGQLIQMR